MLPAWQFNDEGFAPLPAGPGFTSQTQPPRQVREQFDSQASSQQPMPQVEPQVIPHEHGTGPPG